MGGTWYIQKIIIDSREKERGINAYNYYIDNYDVGIESLKYGDYYFRTNDGKDILFEYKTCEDFINSMTNKSLFNEVANQTLNILYSYLIIVGDFDETYEKLYFNVPSLRYKYKSLPILKYQLSKQIKGAFNRIYSMHVPIIFVEDEKDAFKVMLEVSMKIADTKKYGGLVRPIPKVVLKENPTSFFLTSVKGIGIAKAENIVKSLGIECLDDLCKVSASEFLSVDKISENNVKEMWKKIHNEEVEWD